MEILLDGNIIKSKEELFITLKNQINSDIFYGNNLDSLWDVLSGNTKNVIITIKNKMELDNNLKEYSKKLLNLFDDLKVNNKNVTIITK